MKNFFHLYKIYLKTISKYKWLYGLTWFTTLLLLIVNNYLVFTLKDIINSIESETELLPALFRILIVLSIPIILEPIVFMAKAKYFTNGVQKLYNKLYNHVVNQDYAFHINRQTGKLISKVLKTEQLVKSFSWDVEWWIIDAIASFLIPIGLMLTLNTLVAGVTFAATLLSLPLLYIGMRANVKARKLKKNAEYDRNSVIIDGLSNFETVRSFGNENFETHILNSKTQKVKEADWKYQLSFRLNDLLIRIAGIIIFMAASLTAYYLYQNRELSSGGIVVVITYQFQLIGRLSSLFYPIRGFITEMPYLEDVVDLLETKSDIKETRDPKEIQNPKGEIVFQNVAFGYKDGNQVINDLDLTIKPEQTVAFVGPSGGGKTTAVRLLMRYYDASQGNIEIDGINIKDLSNESLRTLFGLVPQEPVLFNRSIFYNVAYALNIKTDEDSKKYEELVYDACKKAQIHTFIDSLPKGYDTQVGERGLKLSGGQKQRIAIARVIIKDPKIIIFDEATSMLDSESESAIQKAFSELSKDKTTIVIAHRLSTIKDSDKIFVIDKGVVTEQGTHDKLLSQKSLYSKLWEIQSGGFVKG